MTLVLPICLRLLVDCFESKLLFLRFWMLICNGAILNVLLIYQWYNEKQYDTYIQSTV